MTEHERPRQDRREKPKAEKTMSFYYDNEFRTEFSLLAAVAAKDRENLEHLKTVFVPKLLKHSARHSRTPRLDCAFIEGVLLGATVKGMIENADQLI